MPRIVLGTRAIQAAVEYAKQDEIWEAYRNARLLRDQDGVWFLNYLAEIGIFNRQNRDTPEMREHPLYQVGQSIRQIIQTKIDTTLDQPDIYAKVDWLARYWNAEVALAGGRPEPALGWVALAGQEPRTTPLPFKAH
jgi:hypothetical protein